MIENYIPWLIVIGFLAACAVALWVWDNNLNKGEHWTVEPKNVYRRIDGKIVASARYDEDTGIWHAHAHGRHREEFKSELRMIEYLSTAGPLPPETDRSAAVKAAIKKANKGY